ncbi:hypothetical protein H6P81_020600 [Aristolochia fimbriata]|uniref:Uncharacterized protein n=1 Tax=Aristolochia fimbriata TaxID=158543 RepID=A0AAV7DUU0_ARIFI|nr:hypothetical protein H6P81_020600 [Aristolochia fimbriata]
MEDALGLLCQETQSCLNEDEEEEDRFLSMSYWGVSETEDEYIEMLVSKESSFESKCADDGSEDNWLKCMRLDAVRWILKTRVFFGFSYQTAYLSVTYLDRFLSRRSIDKGKSWAVLLLSVACLSVAAKMEEPKVPPLSQFQVEDYGFGSKVIQRMELLLLNTLEWRMNSVTPFAYLNYFISKFTKESRPKTLFSRSVDLILASAEEMNLIDHRPSSIAAASVLAASDQRLTKRSMDIKIDTISLSGSLDNDHVFSCYNLLWKLRMKLPKIELASDFSSICSSSLVDILEDASFTSIPSKRRRLYLNDDDEKRIH